MAAITLSPAHLTLLLIDLGISFGLFFIGAILDLAGKQGALIMATSIIPPALLFMNATHFAVALIGIFVWSLLQGSGLLTSLKENLVKHAKFTLAGLPAQS